MPDPVLSAAAAAVASVPPAALDTGDLRCVYCLVLTPANTGCGVYPGLCLCGPFAPLDSCRTFVLLCSGRIVLGPHLPSLLRLVYWLIRQETVQGEAALCGAAGSVDLQDLCFLATVHGI